MKPERDPGEQPDFGVGGFDESLGETVVEVGVDRLTVSGDLFGQFDEGWELGSAGPGQPFVERFFAFFSFDGEHVAEAFFEKVGPPQFGVGLGDPVELLTLTWVEIIGVFHSA